MMIRDEVRVSWHRPQWSGDRCFSGHVITCTEWIKLRESPQVDRDVPGPHLVVSGSWKKAAKASPKDGPTANQPKPILSNLQFILSENCVRRRGHLLAKAATVGMCFR